MSNKKISLEQETAAFTRFKNGEPGAEIWKSLGISKRSFYNILERNGVERRPVTKRTSEEEIAIVTAYVSGEGAYAIANRTGAHVQTIYNILARHKTGTVLDPIRLDAHQRLAVIDACVSGGTVEEVATVHGVSVSTVQRILGDNGVSLPKGRPPSCTINHRAFDEYTPEANYWKGFLFADGCVSDDKYGAPYLICALAHKDRAHLDKLRTFLGSSHALSYVEKTKTSLGGPFARWGARSKRLCAMLRSDGIIAKKLRVPCDELTDSPDFWRGMVDGDGALGTYVQDGRILYPYIMLSGQIPLLEQFQKFLVSHNLPFLRTGLAGEMTGSVFKISTTSGPAAKIIEILYKNANVTVLDRKNNRAQAIIAGDLRRFAPYVESESHCEISLPVEEELQIEQ